MQEKYTHTLQIDPAKCIGCGLCQKDCPANNIQVSSQKAAVLTQSCIMCGHCVAICPKGAVSMTGFDEPPREIKEQIRVDPEILLEALRSRRSIRQFTDRKVEPELLARIIEAGRLTPTGGNAQEVSYLVLTKGLESAEQLAVQLFRRVLPLKRLVNPIAKRMTIDDHFFFKKAPAAVLVVSRDRVDGALASSNMALMAEACGLGVLYSGFFALAANRSGALRRRLGLKRREKVVTALVLGYSSVRYPRTAQKEAASVRQI